MQTSHRHSIIVVSVAVLARAIYLWQASTGPFFAEPLVDARTYHDLARALAERGTFDNHFLWQAPFFPLALAGLYKVVGVSVAAARVAGAVVGVITVVVTWHLGRRLLGPRGGLAAGLVTALNGVLVFFETELLATGLATLWMVTMVALLVDLAARPRAGVAAALGVVGALALLTRTLLLPPLLVGLGWLAWRLARGDGGSWRRAARPLILAAGGFLLVVGSFASIAHRHTGHAGLLPPSGAINLYLGNNPDFPATLGIRPGLPWEALVAAPVAHTGVNDPWVSAGWYRDRVSSFVAENPGAWLGGMGRKALHLLSSRELPRNVDIDLHRPWSSWLAGSVWTWGRFGFPAGLLLPLGVVGLVLARRRITNLLPLVAGTYAVGLVLVFTAARYRAPLLPLLAVAAVGAVMALMAEPSRRRRMATVVGVLALVLMGTIPGPFAQESIDLEAELWHGVGFNQLRRGESAAAAASFRRAVSARDHYPEAWNRLGVSLARQDSFAASIPCFERAQALAPDYPDPPGNLDLARTRAAQQSFELSRRLEGEERDGEAIVALREALAFTPEWPEAQARLAWILATSSQANLRDGAEALTLARAALAGHGEDHPWLLEVLAAAESQIDSESR